jgi:sRNA-binding regulator protein Hfq
MAYKEFLQKLQNEKTTVKVFLSNKTMLSGKITDYDEDCIVVNKCMALKHQVISVTPE